MPSSQTQQDQSQRRFKLAVLLVSSFFVAIFILWWIFTRAYLEINVQTTKSGEITYEVLNQSDRKKAEIKRPDKHLKKQVSKGSYEITVRQDIANFFSVTETGGTFSTTTVNAKLEPEKARRFIGNTPQSCTHILANTLLSYECAGSFDTLKTHVPATANLPTLTRPTFGSGEDIIQGIVRTSKGEDILVAYEAVVAGHAEFEEEDHPPHIAFKLRGDPLGSDLDLTDGTPLTGLNQKIHSVIAYKDGFIAYDKPITQALYYSSLGAQPTELPIEDLGDESLTPQYLSVQGEAYVVGYTNEDGELTTTMVYQDEQPKKYAFDTPISAARICAPQTLCVVNEDGLDVYDIKNEKSKLLYHVGEVVAVGSLGSTNRLIAVRNHDVLDLDVEARIGSIQYTFGKYDFCGINFLDASYSLCVKNKSGSKSILAIDQQQPSDNIDQKIVELSSLKEVNNISMYGDFIFITPNAGTRAFNREADGYIYNPTKVRNANNKINQAIKDLGFDKNKYKIKNTIE